MTLYLDTSSLVKLYVTEVGSESVHQLVQESNVVATSVVAYPEALAALARLRREGGLTAARMRSTKRDLELQWPTYLRIAATDTLCRVAGELAEKYALRGFDSIHLASFADVVATAGIRDTRFSSFDARLNAAAQMLTRALHRRGRQTPAARS